MAFNTETLAKGAAARANKTLDVRVRTMEGAILTRRELVALRHAEGYRLECVRVPDESARRAAERVVETMSRRWVPTGNEFHPDTIRYRAAQATVKAPPMIDEWRHSSPDGVFRVLTLAERDYARSLES